MFKNNTIIKHIKNEGVKIDNDIQNINTKLITAIKSHYENEKKEDLKLKRISLESKKEHCKEFNWIAAISLAFSIVAIIGTLSLNLNNKIGQSYGIAQNFIEKHDELSKEIDSSSEILFKYTEKYENAEKVNDAAEIERLDNIPEVKNANRIIRQDTEKEGILFDNSRKQLEDIKGTWIKSVYIVTIFSIFIIVIVVTSIAKIILNKNKENKNKAIDILINVINERLEEIKKEEEAKKEKESEELKIKNNNLLIEQLKGIQNVIKENKSNNDIIQKACNKIIRDIF
ncbi:hypothetical protein CBE01nite_29720 [Clostridium beijerinckii]|uniref:Uncharacterized protein n=1 Tax=Clostridium beijerinckii TaxID=1520 RepID=A0AB74VDF1_CLOBE|nr:hypothetical protein [Clostridium beijerinckii]NRZ28752.1 putative membrane protein [Clostridium beijerinckii]NYB95472.1 putative membrane protein [Clostridium beijerinckii]OOM24587.1 hypothetical protein CLBEI_20480 [Clostridium beijerinckii]QUN34430.1 hypothetical protein KEC93_21275 [Clostridium beijerinckii]SQB00616.1 Uncharacterised protein [Clostridium beijerinckii]